MRADYWLGWIASYLIVIAILAIGAGLQEWLAWRKTRRIIVFALLVLALPHPSIARDLGQWGGTDPAIGDWYRGLMQPDNPTSSCCGEADSYWADEVHVRNGKTFVIVTDDRDDGPRVTKRLQRRVEGVGGRMECHLLRR